MTAKEAYKIMESNLKENTYITGMAECTNNYVFGVMERGDEGKYRDISGYDSVDKNTGEVGFMHFFDYADEIEAGTLKEIDISTFQQVS